ncbi:putative trypsin-6 [Dissostichus eleginoides]|uniref:Trypsin-6 n=1 Tax=Dissostichus eleginoides TaxID=100907 RepID=A0AAD9CTS3_DISEL|nr:putative trypsin-6 [Dissostichus eleginoides]
MQIKVKTQGVTVSRVVDLDKRVYNGVPCDKKDRLYHVKLVTVNAKKESFWSGGSLISEQWILTAGHNVEPGETVTAILGFHPGTNMKEVKITEEPIRYSDTDGNHDIMLLKLPPGHGYPIAPTTDCNKPPIETNTVEIGGIGATQADPLTRLKGGPLKTALQCGDTKVVKCEKKQTCPTVMPIHYNKNEKLICFQTTNVDASKGDSGGGVVFQGMIYGVIIRGGKYACQVPASAINICDPQYKKWINDKTGLKIK